MIRHCITALLGLLFCLGCAGKALQPGSSIAIPADTAAYLKVVLKKARSLSNVSGFATLKIVSQAQHTNSRNIFFVNRLGRIRIETLGFLSRPALLFTADQSRMNLYAVDRNEFYTGDSSSENFSRIIGLPLELPDIVDSFLGQPPLHECQNEKISCAVENDELLFTVNCAGRTEQFYIDPKGLQVRRYRLLENSAPVYEYAFSQYEIYERAIFPLKIEIYHYTYKTAVTLIFESLSFDAIPDERFSISPPQGAQVHSIEDIGAVR